MSVNEFEDLNSNLTKHQPIDISVGQFCLASSPGILIPWKVCKVPGRQVQSFNLRTYTLSAEPKHVKICIPELYSCLEYRHFGKKYRENVSSEYRKFW